MLRAAVPETAIHKNRELQLGKNEIGLAKHRLIPPPAGDALRPEYFASASSVSLFPRPRIRDITSDRLALVKTSGIDGFTVVSRQRETTLHFIRLVRVHPVIKTAPLRVAAIQFFVGEFVSVRATPRFSGEAFQRARPAAPGVFVTVGMQAGKEIRDG